MDETDNVSAAESNEREGSVKTDHLSDKRSAADEIMVNIE